MLIISNGVADTYLDEGLRALRRKILLHWSEKLAASARLAGEDGCAFVLNEVEEAARVDPDLTESDLMMLADLSLVSHASEKRRQQN
jgi:hypothetical protein